MQALAHSRRCLFVLAAAALGACSSGTEPPTATSIQITSSQGSNGVTLAALGQTIQLTAKVLDQHGDSMPGVSVAWSSNGASIASVSSTGLVTAVANGTAQITASAGGSATKSVDATVAQAVATLTKTGGDAQAGQVATALANPVMVLAKDALGSPIANLAVTWSVTTGGGTIAGGNTDASGVAQAAWTPGNTAGSASATAHAGNINAVFTATLSPGPASQVTIVTGNNQTAAVNTAVGINPKVRVADQFGNVRTGHTVTWTVTAGGGSVQASAGNAATSTTDASGNATVVSWTVGASAGANSLQASAGAGVTTSFSATGATVGGPTAIAVYLGNNQTALATFPTNIRPAVRVTDINNLPVSGQQVVFTPSAGGSVTGGTVNTDVNGIAQVGSWTPGTTAGAATLGAAATGTALSQVFNATAQAPQYQITLNYQTAIPSAGAQAAFDSAVAKWETVIYGDLPGSPGPDTIPAGVCGVPAGGSSVILNATDDIVILVRFDSIDGPLQILGSAGPCYIRTGGGPGDRLTIFGQMRFDTADVALLVGSNRFTGLVLHEMGHVLGIGTLWTQTQFNCLQNPSAVGTPADSYYNCAKGRAAFDSIGGTNYTGGNKVPVENTGGAGTINGHWRESVFDTELMTGIAEAPGVMTPMSLLTIQSLEDLGYLVNNGAQEPYNQIFSVQGLARVRAADGGLEFHDDIDRGPIYLRDRSGRVVGVFRP